MPKKDNIFDAPIEQVKQFAFDERVASVFDDMIARSVPFYDEVQSLTSALMAQTITPSQRIYDLGCSTGNSFKAFLERIEQGPARELIGIDNSPPMLDRCRERFVELSKHKAIFLQEDLGKLELKPCSVVLLNYTLQFVEPSLRPEILSKIWQAMDVSGAMIFTEKICHSQEQIQDLLTSQYYDFKRRNGYSEMEIAQKREALENFLRPFTMEQNLLMLKDAGFHHCEIILKTYTFATIIAFK
ncbi:MAG: carboxy-S-adenosyl-L-methionine synthase CmoA [Lentisphaeria bacterium]|nr:carboxy-S-adenosyl-L-methionine synthase CmoA [Lentisphaeria bacterium]